MPPLNKNHFVYGEFSLKGGKLTFTAGGGQLGYYARQAMDAGRNFSITLTPPEGVKEFTGKVLSVELVKGAKPLRYEIIMRAT